MTREDDEARCDEIDAMSGVSDRFKRDFRQGMVRRHRLEDAGVIDMWQWKHEREMQTLGW